MNDDLDRTGFELVDAFLSGVRAATLRCESSGELVSLWSGLLVGRSSRCDLILDETSVSGRHAQLTFGQGTWRVRDMGSRNGTRLDGRRLEAGVDRALDAGSVLEFGLDERVWRLIDDRPPGDEAIRRPDATLLTATAHRPVSLGQIALHFHVSADEQHASWEAEIGDERHDLGDRSYVYLLVTLARLRHRDRDQPVDRRGWTAADELARGLEMTPETLKVHVYRAREALRSLDVLGAGGLVERRASSNQIRLGTDRIAVHVS